MWSQGVDLAIDKKETKIDQDGEQRTSAKPEQEPREIMAQVCRLDFILKPKPV